tara:strand:+ start:158 stop:409 length:252 start_codon:yes stop_codon:yes gene_type:complete
MKKRERRELRATWFTLTKLVDQALTDGNNYIGHVLPNGMTIAGALEETKEIREKLYRPENRAQYLATQGADHESAQRRLCGLD